ncbi:acyltransferase [Paenibacillus sp. BSR1-1]|uniref:acyltransferase family protein n=1 Tax=Paenibacillus sp. BSR1-1 TaxID=3020845 RepID=UPI0025B1700E|nr:acyltransferase [Paenibacillus sp. BSR1-1]MDN3019201.1 acyltransferase [Paenibacillus sp. BSR1-1]
MSNRYEELDSLRGLAALAVLFSHFLLVFKVIEIDTYNHGYKFFPNIFKYSPLHIFFGGHESVILFFVLSGFVLSLAFLKNNSEVSYRSFLLKRFFRLYPPFIFAVILAFFAKLYFNSGNLQGLSHWVQNAWSTKSNLLLFLQHVIIFGNFDANDIDPVLWSLVHEMRISIIFPFLILLVKKKHWIFCVFLSVASSFVALLLRKHFWVDITSTSYVITLHYCSMFVLGSLLAKHKNDIQKLYQSSSTMLKSLLLICGLICYTFSWLLFNHRGLHNTFIDEWSITLGACVFIIFALSSKKASKFLLKKPIFFLGKISYSLYLFHVIILISFLNIFSTYFPTIVILAFAFICSILISWLGYKYIELPFIKIGRRFLVNKRSKLDKDTSIAS